MRLDTIVFVKKHTIDVSKIKSIDIINARKGKEFYALAICNHKEFDQLIKFDYPRERDLAYDYIKGSFDFYNKYFKKGV